MKKTKLITGIVLAAAVVVLGWWMLDPGADNEGSTAQQRESVTNAEGSPIVQVQLPAELSPEAQLGKRGFEAKCAACHGENAAGQNGIAPPLVHKIYEPSHHGDAAFQLAAKNGVRAHHWRFGNMPPIEGIIPADVTYITAYVRELQRANGIN